MTYRPVAHVLLLALCMNVHDLRSDVHERAAEKKREHCQPKSSKRFLYGAERTPVVIDAREGVDSAKRIKRHGILFKRPRARATVLICHGYGTRCDKYYVSFLHHMFRNCTTMTFDFRAHGERVAGQYCTFGRNEAYDVLAAVRFIKKQPDLKKMPLFIYGFSMGAVATIMAAAINPALADGLILDCPFESSDNVIERGIKKMQFSFFGYTLGVPGSGMLRTHAYNPYVQSLLKRLLRSFASMDSTRIKTKICPVYPAEAMRHVSIPAFMICCKNDEYVPEEAVRQVYERARGYKRLWITPGRNHCDSMFYAYDEYAFRINRFIQSIISGTYKKRRQCGEIATSYFLSDS